MPESAARELVSLFTEKSLTFAAAESCTGGMIGATVTDCPGASAVYLGGVIAYANSVKESVLGVRAETLARFGAVSPETAREMAEGVRRLTGADIAVAVTGIAGPGGGSEAKPVGTVCFGIACAGGTDAVRVQFDPGHTREEIRRETVMHAFRLTIRRAGAQ